MTKNLKLLLLLSMVGLFAFGCGQEQVPMQPLNNSGSFNPALAANAIIPPGATLTSATFYIWVNVANNETVNVHRITSPWDEATATWNNFGGAYAPEVFGSFVADGIGWRSVDVLTLVDGWVDGDYPNYGLLLDQVPMNFPRARYNSKEAGADHPYLEICYTTSEGPACEIALDLSDTYIWQFFPNNNYGASDLLYTGWLNENDLEKQSLLLFDITVEEEPPSGCSRTIGYWKTHAGFGPQADDVTPLLPIWLGDAGGANSINVTTAAIAVDILKQNVYGDASNGITKLYAQLLGAKLNIEAGASDDDVAAVIAAADAFLADHFWTDWDSLTAEEQEMVLDWHDTLDDYNNGEIGPGHCE